MRKLAVGIGALAAAGAFAAATAPADAAAPTECKPDPAKPFRSFCPLNTGNVPVYAAPGSNRQVGVLRLGGSANWFLWQVRGQKVTIGGFTNVWWAYTQSDRVGGKPGARGYVPEVYFSGGGVNTVEPANHLTIRTLPKPVPRGVPQIPAT
jgi:hypothetical protein